MQEFHKEGCNHQTSGREGTELADLRASAESQLRHLEIWEQEEQGNREWDLEEQAEIEQGEQVEQEEEENEQEQEEQVEKEQQVQDKQVEREQEDRIQQDQAEREQVETEQEE